MVAVPESWLGGEAFCLDPTELGLDSKCSGQEYITSAAGLVRAVPSLQYRAASGT